MKLNRLMLIISLLGGNACDCSNRPVGDSQTTAFPRIVQTNAKEYWHTGEHQSQDLLEVNQEAISNTYGHLPTNYTYKIYRVQHKYPATIFHCGYHAFIPILLESILVNNQWEDWLNQLHKTLYEPISRKAVPGTPLYQLLEELKRKEISIDFDEFDELYQNVRRLFQSLSQEPNPRKLKSEEVTLLVIFLKGVVSLHKFTDLLNKLQEVKNNPMLNRKKLIEAFEHFILYGLPHCHENFIIFNIPYFFIDQEYKITGYNKISKNDPLSSLPIKKLPDHVRILLYQQIESHFDYIIIQEKQE